MSTLCLLHGFTGSGQSFAHVLAGLERPALSPALLGHSGAAAAPEIHGFEQEAERLHALAREHAPLTLVGYSLGARLALAIALRHPSSIASLVLISGHPGLSTRLEREQRIAADQRWQQLLESAGIEAFVDTWQAEPLWATQAGLPSVVRAAKRQERLSHDPLGLSRSLSVTGLGQMPSYRERLGEISAPVYLLSGARDPKFSALAEEMAGALPQAEHVRVADAGHDLLLERPDLITHLLTKEPFQ